jgi:hypothetical protein
MNKSYTGTKTHKNVKVPITGFNGSIVEACEPITNRIMIGIPATGLVRMEWVLARYGQVIPCNWSQSDMIHFVDQFSPLGFMVADARNLIVTKAVEGNFQWVFFIDHDTIMPPHTILTWNERMLKGDVPVFGGVYFTKGNPAEPLVYRGNGTSYYSNWKFGDEVWVDGMGMGCTMIHVSVLKVMYDEAESYMIGPHVVKRIFQTPSRIGFDPQTMAWSAQSGTEDLAWCDKVRKTGVLKRAGWTDVAKKRYPFLIDTNVFCKHINNDGVQYPSMGEERRFLK